MYDYHIHPNYSIDAEGSIEEYCDAALKKGLKEIAFTTHLDTDSKTEDCFVNVRGKRVDTRSSIWLEDYEANIRAAGDKYESKELKVLLGVELDYIPNIEGALPESFFSTDFDIILGSMHLIDHIPISAKRTADNAFRKYSLEELGEKYYSNLQQSVESNLFDIVAHIDLYRRYGQKFYGEDIRDIWRPHIESLAGAMKRNNVGFEINTSPLRKGQQQPMPEPTIVMDLYKQGVSLVTAGSDAHTPQDVGANINDAYQLLRETGFSHISLFDKRTSRTEPIP
ncbi:MAG: histidinol-phosphatase [Candidatus Thorarchaeota archaeon]